MSQIDDEDHETPVKRPRRLPSHDPDAPPTLAWQLHVNGMAVRVDRIDGLQFISLDSPCSWLTTATRLGKDPDAANQSRGVARRAEFQHLRSGQTLTAIYDAIFSQRSLGRHLRTCWKVGADGNPLGSVLDISLFIYGMNKTSRVVNTLSAIKLEATDENILWLIDCIKRDMVAGEGPTTRHTKDDVTALVAASISTSGVPGLKYNKTKNAIMVTSKYGSGSFILRRQASNLKEEVSRQLDRAIHFAKTGVKQNITGAKFGSDSSNDEDGDHVGDADPAEADDS